MAKTKISEYDATAANNTDVNSINIAEGCAPSGINNAIRQVMADLKDFQQGTKGDAFLGPVTPSTLTLTGLTANRILYTNASKQVSSSDNVQFDGTTVTINSLVATSLSATSLSSTGVSTFAAGSAGAPAITFAGDTNTGIFSPTADTIAFTEGGVENMRVNSVGLSLTSSNAGGTTGTLRVLDHSTNNGSNTIQWTNNAGSAQYGYIQGLAAQGLAFGNGGAEVMRIDSNGNVGIGTSSPSYKLQVNGGTGTRISADTTSGVYYNRLVASQNFAYSGIEYASLFNFVDGATERMRIDSSGSLLVNTTSSWAGAKFETQSSIWGVSGYSTAASGFGAFVARVDNVATNLMMFYYTGATNVGSITTNGTLTVYGTTSDYRLKTNIEPMQNALSKIKQLNPVTYKWKSNNTDEQGFIAHELQAVFPSAVTGSKDAVDEDGKPVYQNIDPSKIVATLTKAIQEQQAMIETLTTRLNAIEGK